MSKSTNDRFSKMERRGLVVGEEWDVNGMVEGYSIDGPQAPSNAHRDRDEKINFRRITSRAS